MKRVGEMDFHGTALNHGGYLFQRRSESPDMPKVKYSNG